MSVWIRNLKSNLENLPVVILHGNVRDKYIDEDRRVYENLTTLLTEVAERSSIPFSEYVFYNPVIKERKETRSKQTPSAGKDTGPANEFGGTEPERRMGRGEDVVNVPPSRILARWVEQLSETNQNHFMVLFYLDKLVAYKNSYSDNEKEILLWLERIIENIKPNHRLIMVALQDTMIPIELYTNSPKTTVLPIPMPGKNDRVVYLKHRLGDEYKQLELISDLTDGMFLRDLDNIVNAITSKPDISVGNIRRLVNKYRIGEQEDYWGTLSIEKLDGAPKWFINDSGVKGQEEAVDKVIKMLCLARAGLSGVASGAGTKPKGVLFFAGPTGVGKTFLAKKLAEFLFGTEEAFLRYDMSEFKEEHTVSKFIGSPPGYVGFEQGGKLTNDVRGKPFSVILFDEIEKAHPKIMDIFLQILDDGRLTDSRGKTVFFTETVIIFTSNLGTRTTDSRGTPVDERNKFDAIFRVASFSDTERKNRIRNHFTDSVERFFLFEISRPELLNRIGNNIVPFNCINDPSIQIEIIQSHLRRIKEEIEDKNRSAGYKVIFQDNLVNWLAEKYSDRITMFGGRGITNAIENELMVPLSKELLETEYKAQQNVTFNMELRNGTVFVTKG